MIGLVNNNTIQDMDTSISHHFEVRNVNNLFARFGNVFSFTPSGILQ